MPTIPRQGGAPGARPRLLPRLEPLEGRQLLAAGALDPSFGAGGTATIAFDLGRSSFDVAAAVAVLPDGRVVLAGFATGSGGNDFAVARLTASGALDTTFGVGGKATVAFDLGGSNDDVAFAVAVLPDGRVVVAGSAERSSRSSDFAVARLTASGALDTTFGVAARRPSPSTSETRTTMWRMPWRCCPTAGSSSPAPSIGTARTTSISRWRG